MNCEILLPSIKMIEHGETQAGMHMLRPCDGLGGGLSRSLPERSIPLRLLLCVERVCVLIIIRVAFNAHTLSAHNSLLQLPHLRGAENKQTHQQQRLVQPRAEDLAGKGTYEAHYWQS